MPWDFPLVAVALNLATLDVARFNMRHRAIGSSVRRSLQSGHRGGEQRHYYETLMDYSHLNPVRAGVIRPAAGQSLLDFAWSRVAGAPGAIAQPCKDMRMATAG
jgi:hypothetical protein